MTAKKRLPTSKRKPGSGGKRDRAGAHKKEETKVVGIRVLKAIAPKVKQAIKEFADNELVRHKYLTKHK